MQLSKDPSWKGIVSTSNSAGKLTAAGLTAWKAATSGEVIGRLSTRYTPILSSVTGFLTAGLCLWDAAESFDKGDDDAAIMMGLAGLAFGVGAYATLGAIYPTLAVAGPVGWIAALVGTGFLVLAYMFTDAALKTYFKNYLLSDHYTNGFPLLANESPMAYNRRIFAKKHILTDKQYTKTMMLPSEAEAKLLDLLVCPNVLVKREKTNYFKKRAGSNRIQKGLSNYRFTAVTARLSFANLLNDVDNLEVKAYLCYNGLNDIRNKPGEVTVSYPIMEIDKNGQSYIHVSATLTEYQRDLLLDESEIFFTVRLAINKKLYFPYPRKGEDYYLSFRSRSLKDSKNTMFSDFQEEFVEIQEAKFLPFSELKSKKTW